MKPVSGGIPMCGWLSSIRRSRVVPEPIAPTMKIGPRRGASEGSGTGGRWPLGRRRGADRDARLAGRLLLGPDRPAGDLRDVAAVAVAHGDVHDLLQEFVLEADRVQAEFEEVAVLDHQVVLAGLLARVLDE